MLVNTGKERVTVQAHKIIVDPPIYPSRPLRHRPISSLSLRSIAASALGGGTSPAITEFIPTKQWGGTVRRSPPRRGYGGRGRSPPRRGYGGRREQSSGSLLVRNIPLSCRPDDLRVPFERFGPVRDVYLPKDFYSQEPRGFAFVEFVDPYDASEAQYHMNRQVFLGREITVVVAAESRKRPDDMRNRDRVRGYSGEHQRRHSRYGRSRSRSRSYSPRYRGRPRSRSYSPAPRRRDDYSASPPRSHHAQSPKRQPKGHEDDKRRSRSPAGRGGGQHDGKRSPPPDSHGSPPRRRSRSGSPVGSRSRSPDASPARSD